jgi:hypothetical protein
MELVPVIGRSILFSFLIFIKIYSKVLAGLNRISQKMHKEPLLEADYINYRYTKTKPIPVKISDQPVGSGLGR